MNYLRKIVSGKRRRFQDTQFDLDMTYITPRVIGMSYPASGYVETTYRNPIAKVSNHILPELVHTPY
jgi:phosphatidylinositol-3,4,5-trisphosphate 3-phosphatase/dual-specificity protein phosphatase PTEN